MGRVIRSFGGSLVLLLFCTLAANAQLPGGINQEGPVTPNDCVQWVQNGVVKDSGSGCGGTSGITIGTTVINGGTTGDCLYDNGGVVGNQSCNGGGGGITIGAGVSGCGTSGAVLFSDPSSLLQCASGFVVTNNTATLNLGTLTSGGTGMTINTTWNNSATTFTAPAVINVVPTASNRLSKYFDIQNNGTSIFTIQDPSNGQFPGVMTITSPASNFGTMAQFLAPSLNGGGGTAGISLGVDNTNVAGTAQFTFIYSAPGSAANAIGISFSDIGIEWQINGAGQETVVGSVNTPAYIVTGSPPTLTGTCSSLGTQTPGNTAGTFKATCVAQTAILTFVTTAPNGWICSTRNLTTPADVLAQIAPISTTSATLSGTTAAGDVISFQCTGT